MNFGPTRTANHEIGVIRLGLDSDSVLCDSSRWFPVELWVLLSFHNFAYLRHPQVDAITFGQLSRISGHEVIAARFLVLKYYLAILLVRIGRNHEWWACRLTYQSSTAGELVIVFISDLNAVAGCRLITHFGRGDAIHSSLDGIFLESIVR